MRFDHVDLQKASPNPLEQYPTGGEINEDMMQDTTPSELFPVAGYGTADRIRRQPESAEASDNSQTLLSGRTRSARAIQPRKFVIPPAAVPDDSEDMDSDHKSPPGTTAKPKNKYQKQVLRLAAAKRRVSQWGF